MLTCWQRTSMNNTAEKNSSKITNPNSVLQSKRRIETVLSKVQTHWKYRDSSEQFKAQHVFYLILSPKIFLYYEKNYFFFKHFTVYSEILYNFVLNYFA